MLDSSAHVLEGRKQEIGRLKQEGFSDQQIADQFRVSRQAISSQKKKLPLRQRKPKNLFSTKESAEIIGISTRKFRRIAERVHIKPDHCSPGRQFYSKQKIFTIAFFARKCVRCGGLKKEGEKGICKDCRMESRARRARGQRFNSLLYYFLHLRKGPLFCIYCYRPLIGEKKTTKAICRKCISKIGHKTPTKQKGELCGNRS